MIWVNDFKSRYVNINNFDTLEVRCIFDNNTKNLIIWEIFLTKENKEIILGYIEVEDYEIQDIFENITKGICLDFLSLDDALCNYLDKQKDEEFKNINFNGFHNTINEYVNNLIGTRFIKQ